jgi:hypothetical protein
MFPVQQKKMAADAAATQNKYGNYCGFFGVGVAAGGRGVFPAGRVAGAPAPAGLAAGATGLSAL